MQIFLKIILCFYIVVNFVFIITWKLFVESWNIW